MLAGGSAVPQLMRMQSSPLIAHVLPEAEPHAQPHAEPELRISLACISWRLRQLIKDLALCAGMHMVQLELAGELSGGTAHYHVPY